MFSSKKLINKVHHKMAEGSCHFCKETEYSVLDCHRIIPGEVGGKYNEINSVVCCSNCHRKVHAGTIKIDRKYFSTNGKWVLHYFIGEEEFWN